MSLSFWIMVIVLFVIAFKLIATPIPQTTMEELKHLLSLDEAVILEREPRYAPERKNILLDFTVWGEYLQLHYRSECGGTYIQDIWVVVLSTKASLYARFENGHLCHFKFRGKPFWGNEKIYPEGYYLQMARMEPLISGHALSIAERVTMKEYKKSQEGQLV